MLISVSEYNEFDNAPSPLLNSDQITAAIEAATYIIETRTGRTFVVLSASPSPSPVDTVEIVNGLGCPRVYTHNAPIISVSKLEWWDGMNWQEYDDTSYPRQVKANSNIIYLTNQSSWAVQGFTFYKGYQNIRITYTYGYEDELPKDLQYACYLLAKHMLEEVEQGNIQTQTDGEQSYTYFKKEKLPVAIEAIIARYRLVF